MSESAHNANSGVSADDIVSALNRAGGGWSGAQRVAELVREAQRKAWEEGADYGFDFSLGHERVPFDLANPYEVRR